MEKLKASHDAWAEETSQSLPREDSPDDVQQDPEGRDTTQLRRSCQGYIGSLARKYKEIETLMLDKGNIDIVQTKCSQLNATFALYEHK